MKLFTIVGSKKISFNGWCMPHVCVSAAFSSLEHPNQKEVLAFIRTSQKDNGSWTPYWYHDPEYATALAAECLGKTGKGEDLAKCRRAVSWAESRIEKTIANPFVASLNLRTILAAGEIQTPSINRLISYILSSQQQDGGWISSTYLRIPHTNEIDPDSYKYWLFELGDVGSIQKDNRRIFTTATVLTSIGTAFKRLSK